MHPDRKPRCSIDECSKPVLARGWCSAHYTRWQRTGEPLGHLPKLRRPICSVEGCRKPHEARGFCENHYRRWQHHGTPELLPRRQPVLQRFWSKVDKSGDCWEWLGWKNREGYGRFDLPGKHAGKVVAHRFAYEQTVRPVPEGLVLDHLCRNRGCVNPAHLEIVFSHTNTRRGDTIAARNAAKTHCIHGHPFNSENTYVNPRTGYRACETCRKARYLRTYQPKRKKHTASSSKD